MGAILNGQLETVKKIFIQNYAPTNILAFNNTKYFLKDKFGNNPLHLAYKMVNEDIV